jgi:Yip1 domain
MTVVEPGGTPGPSPNIVARAQGLILQPTAEWRRVEQEPATVQGIYKGWLVPLALIAVAAMVIGQTVFGVTIPGVLSYKVSLLDAIVRGVMYLLLLLAMTYVMGLVIDALAINFGGQKNPLNAFKVAAYSGAAMLLAGVFQIIPALGLLGLLGLYSIYILHRGLPVLMKAPTDKATGYTATVVIVMLVLWIIAGSLLNALMPLTGPGVLSRFGVPSASAPATRDSGSITVNGTTVDIGALEKAAKQIEQSAANGNLNVTVNADPVDVEKIKALLPERLVGFTRTEISTGGAAGMGGANATYENGDKRLEVSVVDMGGMGALGGLAGAFSANSTRENADGYERMHTVDGRMTMEKLSKSNKTASYGVMVGNRFMLSVDGTNVGPDDVKNAANAIGVARVEALAQK